MPEQQQPSRESVREAIAIRLGIEPEHADAAVGAYYNENALRLSEQELGRIKRTALKLDTLKSQAESARVAALEEARIACAKVEAKYAKRVNGQLNPAMNADASHACDECEEAIYKLIHSETLDHITKEPNR